MRDVYSPSHGGTVSNIIKIEQGGHGGTTVKEARDNLQVYGLEDIGKPNGLVPLKNGSIPSELLNPALVSSDGIYGPQAVPINSKTTYKINNFDSFKDYKASATHGTISLTEEGLEYNSPSEETTDVISFAGKLYQIDVVENIPEIKVESVMVSDSGTGDYLVNFKTILSGAIAENASKITIKIYSHKSFFGTRTIPYNAEGNQEFSIPRGWINTYGSKAELFLIDTLDSVSATTEVELIRPNDRKKNLWVQRLNINETRTPSLLNGAANIHFSPSGDRLIVTSRYACGGTTYPGQTPNDLTLWKLEDGVFNKKLTLTQSPRGTMISAVTVSADFSKLVISDNDYYSGPIDDSVPYLYFYRIDGESLVNYSSLSVRTIYGDRLSHHAGSVLKFIGDGSHLYIGDIQTGYSLAVQSNVSRILNTPGYSAATENMTYMPPYECMERTYPAVPLSTYMFPDGTLYGNSPLSISGGKINIDSTPDGEFLVVNSPRFAKSFNPTWTDNMGLLEVYKRESNGTYVLFVANWVMNNSNVPVESQGTNGDGIAVFSNFIVRPFIGRDGESDLEPFKGNGASKRNGTLWLEAYRFSEGQANEDTIATGVLIVPSFEGEISKNSWITVVGKSRTEMKVFYTLYNYLNHDLYVCAVKLNQEGQFYDPEILLKTNYSGSSEDGVTLDIENFNNPSSMQVEVNEEARLIAVACRNKYHLDIFKY